MHGCFRKVQDRDSHIQKLQKEVEELQEKNSKLQDQHKIDECKSIWAIENCLPWVLVPSCVDSDYFGKEK